MIAYIIANKRVEGSLGYNSLLRMAKVSGDYRQAIFSTLSANGSLTVEVYSQTVI